VKKKKTPFDKIDLLFAIDVPLKDRSDRVAENYTRCHTSSSPCVHGSGAIDVLIHNLWGVGPYLSRNLQAEPTHQKGVFLMGPISSRKESKHLWFWIPSIGFL
jgi:hypothetical protein